MAEVAADEQLLQRESVTTLDVPGVGPVLVPGLVPKFSRTPGRITHAGPELGADTAHVLMELLGYDSEHVQRLRDVGAV
jgi:formyl-CoA transferase